MFFAKCILVSPLMNPREIKKFNAVVFSCHPSINFSLGSSNKGERKRERERKTFHCFQLGRYTARLELSHDQIVPKATNFLVPKTYHARLPPQSLTGFKRRNICQGQEGKERNGPPDALFFINSRTRAKGTIDFLHFFTLARVVSFLSFFLLSLLATLG